MNHRSMPARRGATAAMFASLVALSAFGSAARCAAEEPVDYLKQIKPVLRERCYACHGGLKQEAGLRLDTVALARQGGDSGAAIRPGDDAGSLLVKRISATAPADRMPPEGEPLKPEQIAAIRRWIAQNSPTPSDEQPERDPRDHWAFRPPVRPEIPKVQGLATHGAHGGARGGDEEGAWQKNPIDAFLARDHVRQQLVPQRPVDRRTWLRRVSLDLIGLPPTLDEQAAFLADNSPEAYDRVVTRLLERPQYGERWGRHWMDVWRYSDWWGLGEQLRNSHKQIWRWRDWIVESLNADMPYDEMVRLMLAADELHPNDFDKLRASGYLARNYFLFNRNQWMEELVENVGKGFLGLTLNCTKCHDHKYDPLAQTDFYQMRAFFEPYHVRTEMVPGEPDLTRDGLPRAFDALLDVPTYRFIRGQESSPDTSTKIAPGVPEVLAFDELKIRPVTLPPEAHQPERRAWVVDSWRAATRKKIETAEASLAKVQERLAEAKRLESARPAAAPAAVSPAKLSAADELLQDVAAPPPPVPSKPAKQAEAKTEPAKTEPKTTEPAKSAALIADRFVTLDATRWKTASGEWKHEPGRLRQTLDGANRGVLRLTTSPPRDFDATVRFTIDGGSRYRSVGLVFDSTQADPSRKHSAGDSELNVYLSALAGQSKLQASVCRDGVWQYPPNGMVARPVELAREYTLRVQVRGDLVNASLDGELALAWRSTLERRDGAMQLITYDALATFHEFTLSALPTDVALVEPTAGRAAVVAAKAPKSGATMTPAAPAVPAAPPTVADAERELAAAERTLEAARAELESVERRGEAIVAAAETEAAKLAAQEAIRSERRLAVAKFRATVADAELRLHRAAADKRAAIQKELDAARQSLEKATQQLAAPIGPNDRFTRFEGARWAATRFLNSGRDDPAVPFPATSTGRRTALAQWLTDRRNPLTARVAANQIWMRHMGTPLVATVFDFGRKGAPPTHADLLDWLAVDFQESGWSMKHLHRLIVTSAAYRMSSSLAGGEANAQRDPDNRYYWRRTPIRLESQVVRDSILSLAGTLDETLGGPPVPAAGQADSKRRSLYFFHSNNSRNLFLATFDEAGVRECYQREQSIVPQQALALSNGRLVHEAAPQIAARIGAATAAKDEPTYVRLAFAAVLASEPNDAEIAACQEAMSAWRKLPEAAAQGADALGRTYLVWALLNHHDFVTSR